MTGALVDVEPASFPEPPDALLAPPAIDAALAVEPSSGDPGSSFTAQGTGFATCVKGWYVTFGIVQSAAESSVEDRRAATLTVPPDAPPGAQRVQAWCDMGDGAQPVAEATFTVNGEASTTSQPATSTSTSSTTTSSEPSSTTTSRPGPPSTTSTSTTTVP
jgi:hypothetical protein